MKTQSELEVVIERLAKRLASAIVQYEKGWVESSGLGFDPGSMDPVKVEQDVSVGRRDFRVEIAVRRTVRVPRFVRGPVKPPVSAAIPEPDLTQEARKKRTG